MRKLQLSKSGLNKLKSQHTDLKSVDLADSIKSVIPGEWCSLWAPGVSESWIAFINPLIQEKYPSIQIVKKMENDLTEFNVEKFIIEKINASYARRIRISGYEKGARIFYGAWDGLPGLIVDLFSNASIIQINTAGIDKYRELISKQIESLTNVESYFLDNPKYREKESLPIFESKQVPSLIVVENDLKYSLRSEVIQKIGFYYDHRENRLQLQSLIRRFSKVPKNGLDLFCYAGAWGINALNSGLEHVDFIDQGDFSEEVAAALKNNGFEDKGSFHRTDVFKFLDTANTSGKKYELILCDPPAFAKSLLQKQQALEGYSKLHRKVFKIASTGSLIAFSSCTHYVSHDEFQKNIQEAADKEGKKIQLIYSGLQGWDHPVSSNNEKSNYIKSYFYISE